MLLTHAYAVMCSLEEPLQVVDCAKRPDEHSDRQGQVTRDHGDPLAPSGNQ